MAKATSLVSLISPFREQAPSIEFSDDMLQAIFRSGMDSASAHHKAWSTPIETVDQICKSMTTIHASPRHYSHYQGGNYMIVLPNDNLDSVLTIKPVLVQASEPDNTPASELCYPGLPINKSVRAHIEIPGSQALALPTFAPEKVPDLPPDLLAISSVAA